MKIRIIRKDAERLSEIGMFIAGYFNNPFKDESSLTKEHIKSLKKAISLILNMVKK